MRHNTVHATFSLALGAAYSSPNPFTGTLKKVEIDTQPANLSAAEQQTIQNMERKARLATE